jgi:phospholipase C
VFIVPGNSLASIRHIVVLMLENRSFDNLLGWQYGLSASDSNRYYNPPPDGPSTTVPSWNNTGVDWKTMTIPNPDPGESFAEMCQQIWGLTAPPPAGSVPTTPGPLGPMGGFAQDYLTIPDVNTGSVANIMHAFKPAQVQALSTLASAFVAVETYFASAPCQTMPNRCFAQLGTAKGYINNETTFPDGTRILNAPYFGPTIFNQISATPGLDWRVYFGDFPLTLAMADVWKYILKNFRWFVDFAADVKNGDLPAYTWIEPSYLVLPNDMHPPHDVLLGDLLVAEVYNALRQSALWESTLLIIMFDEHGGCYDRIFPGEATPPGGPYVDGYTFNRYGVRVPTVLCSPYIPQTQTGTSGPVYDHTSILSTVRSAFSVQGGPLSDRERAANGLGDFLTLSPPNLNLGPESVSAASPASAAPVVPKLNPLQRVLAKIASLVPEPEKIDHTIAALKASQMDRSTNAIRDLETATQMVREAANRLFPQPRKPGN